MSEWLARALAEEVAPPRSPSAKTAKMPKLLRLDGLALSEEEVRARLSVEGVSPPEPFTWHQDDEERAAIAEEVGGVPAVYAGAFAEMQRRCPVNVDVARWRQAVDDSGRFFDGWGSQAVALGWSANDILGIHPTHPLARVDALGLAWLLQGDTVMLMDRVSAKLSCGQTYRRIAVCK
ncbi:MAG: hypothetical protein U1E62_11970 [Alsobacter sp.]